MIATRHEYSAEERTRCFNSGKDIACMSQTNHMEVEWEEQDEVGLDSSDGLEEDQFFCLVDDPTVLVHPAWVVRDRNGRYRHVSTQEEVSMPKGFLYPNAILPFDNDSDDDDDR